MALTHASTVPPQEAYASLGISPSNIQEHRSSSLPLANGVNAQALHINGMTPHVEQHYSYIMTCNAHSPSQLIASYLSNTTEELYLCLLVSAIVSLTLSHLAGSLTQTHYHVVSQTDLQKIAPTHSHPPRAATGDPDNTNGWRQHFSAYISSTARNCSALLTYMSSPLADNCPSQQHLPHPQSHTAYHTVGPPTPRKGKHTSSALIHAHCK